MPIVCADSGPWDFADACTRALWSSTIPTTITVLLGVWAFLRVLRLTVRIERALAPFLTLEDAEEMLYSPAPEGTQPLSVWNTSSMLLTAISCAEALAWFIVAACVSKRAWAALPIALTWVYSSTLLILWTKSTPHYGLLALWASHCILALVDVSAILYTHVADNAPLPPHPTLLARAANIAALVAMLALSLNSPLAVPSIRIDSKRIGISVSPEDYTSLWGWLTFSWISPMVIKGTTNTLHEDDVWEMSPTLRAKPSFFRFQTYLRSTLFRRLFAAHARDILIHLLLVYISVMLEYAQPVFLNRLLSAIETSTTSSARASAVVFALLMFAASVLKTEFDLQYLWLSRRVAANIRSELMAAIYDKALRRKAHTIDSKGKGGADIGRIVNLMNNDALRLSNFPVGCYVFFSAPVELVVACVLLYNVLGWSAFAGFAAFLIVLPINHALTQWGVRIYSGRMGASDKRMSALNELINEVKFIKFFAWEEKWIERVLQAREAELSWLAKGRISSSLFALVWMVVPSCVSVTSFAVFVGTGHTLTVPRAFTAIALFSMLQTPLTSIPDSISQFLHVGVSLKRVELFLGEEDVNRADRTKENGENTVAIETASFTWSQKPSATPASGHSTSRLSFRVKFWQRSVGKAGEKPKEDAPGETPFTLHNIDVSFPPGQLSLITGPTASGKSALLNALLGELAQVSADGRVIRPNGGISYAAQTPWLLHRSIRDNILFGEPFHEERYNAVLDACALKPDLAILEDGDHTEIGARGVSLSGGQKARVALARAVYQRNELVILDDPLSAVDSHTARWLFDKLFRGPLLANRTVILVTHHVDLMLPAAHFVVRMDNGRIVSAGTIRELRAQGVLDEIKHGTELEEDPPAVETVADMTVETAAKTPRRLVQDETRAEGRVKWNIYRTYFSASSYWTWAAIFVATVLYNASRVAEMLWLKVWGEASSATSGSAFIQSAGLVAQDVAYSSWSAHETLPKLTASSTIPSLPAADEHPMFYVGIYAAISLGTATMSILTSVIEYFGAYRASRLLFQQLLVAIVRAPFRWFDITPTGRILNRFTQDIYILDSSLSGSILTFVGTIASALAGIITISYVLPAFLLPAVGVSFIYYKLSVGYLNTGRDLRRMEAVTRSPVFQSFSELLDGIITVRAFCAERQFMERLFGLVDRMNKMWWTFWMLNRFLLFRFDLIGACTVIFTALLGVSTITASGGIAGWVGITITSAMSLTRSIYWACRHVTNLEVDLNSVERVVEYLDLPQEPAAIIPSNRPPAYWPSSSVDSGKPLLSVENLTVKYAPDLPAVLHGVSFALHARERIGILGRTGSGKSTIVMSLLRFVDPAGGRIVVDGIDIATIGVHDLRSRITFIPQDAALFSGTIRDNLDPFGEYSEEECADALARVHLATSPGEALGFAKVASEMSASLGEMSTACAEGTSLSGEAGARLRVTLATTVATGGKNFSQGQRQLVVLARAVLRRSAIVIMDEATSSLDFETDNKIQTAIREEFNNSLLITVAHRLKTVADYDRLVVIDQGNIVELDTPLNLINKQGGHFRSMALRSGAFAELEELAKAAVHGG